MGGAMVGLGEIGAILFHLSEYTIRSNKNHSLRCKVNRLCILDDQKLQLRPVNIRLWFGFLLAFVLGTVLAVSAGAWWVVRQDYIAYSSTLTQVLEQRDNLMRICVARDDAAKQKVKKNVPQNIGGESQ